MSGTNTHTNVLSGNGEELRDNWRDVLKSGIQFISDLENGKFDNIGNICGELFRYLSGIRIWLGRKEKMGFDKKSSAQ